MALFPLGLSIATLVLIQWIANPLLGQQQQLLEEGYFMEIIMK